MPEVRRDGVSVSYEAYGAGFPVLFVHGFGSTGRAWRPQVPVLGVRYRFVTMDMRGHGKSDSPEALEAYSEAAIVDDMLAVLDAERAQQAVIGGLSLGGYMTLAFYHAHPERCRALIVCDTGPGFRNPAAREQWNQRAEERALAFESRGVDAVGRSPEAVSVKSEQRSARGLANAARGMLKQFDSHIMDLLPRITVPVLVIVGDNDTPFLAGSDYMATKIPGARKVTITGAGHPSNIDQPEQFNAAVQSFMNEIGVPSQAPAGA